MFEIDCRNAAMFGQGSDTLAQLLDTLRRYALDRTFEDFGDFATLDPVNLGGVPLYPAGTWLFWGNFARISCVFRVVTDETETVAALQAAIAENKAGDGYKVQPPRFDPNKLQIVPKRFSETQGEVELIYDGRQLEQFGDKIELDGRGRWIGLAARHWEDVARRWLEREHVSAWFAGRTRPASLTPQRARDVIAEAGRWGEVSDRMTEEECAWVRGEFMTEGHPCRTFRAVVDAIAREDARAA